MNKSLRAALLPALCFAIGVLLPSCGGPTLVPAPPGPTDLGPAAGLSTPPPGAVVFDLKYTVQTGRPNDIRYSSFYGYGESLAGTKTNSFLEDVRKNASRLQYVATRFKGRRWAALEYRGRRPTALYFDVNANGKLDENERILPTQKVNEGIDFITPDFIQPLEDGGERLCRVLLNAYFYKGNAEPSTRWAAASLLDGAATFEGRPARLLLYASSPGGAYDQYGESECALLLGDQTKIKANEYIPRQRLSGLISSESRFYRLKVEGMRSNGLPARVVLVKDSSPMGTVAVKLVGSNAVQTVVRSLSVRGVEDKTVFLQLFSANDQVSLPIGTYAVDSGLLAYGGGANSNEWEVSFLRPQNTGLFHLKSGEVTDQTLGLPTLQVQAVEERKRYDERATGSTTIKRGTRLYLQPRIVGKAEEVFKGFREATATAAKGGKADRPPKITITGPDGKELLSKTMEYG